MQYNIALNQPTTLNQFKPKENPVELWKFYRSNFHKNPITESQALSGVYTWIEINENIWIHHNFADVAEMLLNQNPAVVYSENYEILKSAIEVLRSESQPKVISGYVKKAVRQSNALLLSQMSSTKSYGVIGYSKNIAEFIKEYSGIPYIDDVNYSPEVILTIPNLPVLISDEALVELEPVILQCKKDYNYIWNL